jgi:short-subunit dehydrogenase
VTGASSGIGRALCLALARRGVRVAASARSVEALQGLAKEQPLITPFVLDVTDRAAVATVVDAIEQSLGPIDLAVLNAGIGHLMSAARFDAGKAAEVMSVNYGGVANGVEALVRHMVPRKAGHIAIVASLAGYRGVPRAGAYNASKAAAIALSESLKPDLDRSGITMSVINPGFVATPMTAKNSFPMPFMLGADEAAETIVRGLLRRRFEIAFPWQVAALTKLARVLPHPAYFWLMRTFGQPGPRDKPDLSSPDPR